MTDLLVIYDSALEVGAIIVPDQGRAFGPAYIGEGSDDVLRAFIDSTPWDMSDLNVTDACMAFASFLERNAPPVEVGENASDQSTVEQVSPDDMGYENALAEVTARDSTDVPLEQPADTDTEVAAPTETRVVRCYNCEGAGMIEFGDGSPGQRCGMCNGTGKITENVPVQS